MIKPLKKQPSSPDPSLLAAFRPLSKWMLWSAGMAATCVLTGCAHTNRCDTCIPTSHTLDGPNASVVAADRCVDPLPLGAIPSPPGTYVNHWSDAMVQQAANRQAIITRNLWFNGSTELGPDGQEKIMELAESLKQHPHWVWLEEEPLEIGPTQSYEEALAEQLELNAARRNNVINSLASIGVVGIDEFVEFTTEKPVGIRGIEAPQVFNTQFMGGGMGGRGGRGGGGIGGGGGGLGGGGLGGGGFGGGGFGGGGFF